jgi:hypothetical protein
MGASVARVDSFNQSITAALGKNRCCNSNYCAEKNNLERFHDNLRKLGVQVAIRSG